MYVKKSIYQLSQCAERLIFPHTCLGCGYDEINSKDILCYECISQLPKTGFFNVIENPVEKVFWGRLKILQGGALFYFAKGSLMQHLLFELKYKNNIQVGYFFGRSMGNTLLNATLYNHIDALIPLPLNKEKEKIRGYNQAQIICEGIASIWQKPILNNVVSRIKFTSTQTKQNRIQRWQNMENVFVANNETTDLNNKHILLIDDVITTGATLEACGNALIEAGVKSISIATVAYTIS